MARLANPSTAAVSRVLRSAYGVSDEMTARVHSAMHELSYRPHAAARDMRGKTYTVGIVDPDMRNTFFPDIFDAVARPVMDSGRQLLFLTSEWTSTEAVINAMHDRQIEGLIVIAPHTDETVHRGRDLKLQGYENGFFVGPCLFDHVTNEMDIYKEEIFGPVLSVVRATNYEEALSLPMKNKYGNGVAIFTRDGDAARDFASRVNIGMVGINVPIPTPLAYHSFGGWKASSFGGLNQHGTDSIRFWTRIKTVTARWPSGIKDGVEFRMPTMA